MELKLQCFPQPLSLVTVPPVIFNLFINPWARVPKSGGFLI